MNHTCDIWDKIKMTSILDMIRKVKLELFEYVKKKKDAWIFGEKVWEVDYSGYKENYT